MKKIFTLIAVFCVALAWGESSQENWGRVMSDAGNLATYPVGISHTYRCHAKQLKIDFPVKDIQEAGVEYYVCSTPIDWSSPAGTVVPEKGYALADWQVKVNGVVAFEGQPGKLIQPGWHTVPVPVSALKEGLNTVELGWKEPEAGKNSGSMATVYLAGDMSAELSGHWTDRIKKAPQSVQIRLLIRLF